MYDARRLDIIKLFTEYSSEVDNYLGTMVIVQHKIEVEDGANPFRSVPYRAGIKMSDVERLRYRKSLTKELKSRRHQLIGQSR